MRAITVPLETFHEDVRRMAAENERDLAACGGHLFVRMGGLSPHYRCRYCRGIADAARAAESRIAT